jgi:hypothetical protein
VTDLRRLTNVLGQRLPAAPATASVMLTLTSDEPGARAGLTVLGRGYAWIGVERTAAGTVLVCRAAAAPAGPEADLTAPVPVPDGPAAVTLRVSVGDGAVCRFAAGPAGARPVTVGPPFRAWPGQWIGATLGLFAAAPPGDGTAGHADIDRFTMAGG